MESLDGTYVKDFEAEVTAIFPGIVELNQTAFYHLGGGQPADTQSSAEQGGFLSSRSFLSGKRHDGSD